MSDLIARVEAATGGDDGIDAEIWASIDKTAARREPYSSSLDAATGLVERVLPGWHIELKKFSDGWYAALARKSTDSGYDFYRGTQKPAPIALLLALLRSLQQRQGEQT